MRHLLILLIVFIAVPEFTFAENPRRAVTKGIKQYEQEEYDKALAEFLAALESAPDREEVPYDIGTTLYKLESYPEAIGAFGHSLNRDKSKMAADAWYNLGNAMVKVGKLQEAIDAYKNSLIIRHDDLDAKHNLETVLKMIQMQPPQQQQSESSDSTKKQDQQQKQQQKQQEKQSEEQEEQQPQDSQETQTAEQDSTNQQQPDQQNEMSAAEALQLLQALENDEQEAQKEKLIRQFGQPKRAEKDW